MSSIDPGPLLLTIDGKVATITLNRPAQRNAINAELRRLLGETLERLDSDDEVRVCVLTGNGRAFCAGVDLKEPLAATPLQREPISAALDRFGKPLIAAINGPAMGGGLELALAADLRIASTGASFGLPEVRIGSLPGSGGTQRLMRAVTPALAARMLLTGDPIDAEEALAAGLVSDLETPENLPACAATIAQRIAENAPLSLRAAKLAMRAAEAAHDGSGFVVERALWGLLALTEDRAEGRAAFREHRPPNFRGR
jgi:E-phenylitaconyl-CoA hydratase